jgi:predicted esterase
MRKSRACAWRRARSLRDDPKIAKQQDEAWRLVLLAVRYGMTDNGNSIVRTAWVRHADCQHLQRTLLVNTGHRSRRTAGMPMALRLVVVCALLAISNSGDLLSQARAGRNAGTASIDRQPRGRGRVGSVTAARIEQRFYRFPDTNEQIEYAVFVSTKVNRNRNSPLIIALHGLGVTPRDWLPQITDHAQDGGYIVAAPMGYSLTGGYGANGPGGRAIPNLGILSEKDVMYVLQIMRNEFNIDDRRIYLLGQSMGGAGALFLGIKHRHIWAAVGASAPAINAQVRSPSELEQAMDLPFVLIHGDADKAVPVAQTRLWAARMKALGMTYEYHELRGAGHGALSSGARHIFNFFTKHTKGDGTNARSRQAGSGRAGPEIPDVVNALRQRLDRVRLARDRNERFDIRDLDPTLMNVTPLIGVSRQTLLDRLGAPSVDCRRTLNNPTSPSPTRIAPCRAEDNLAYSFYALPKQWVGGGTSLLLEFDDERCIRARWIGTQ